MRQGSKNYSRTKRQWLQIYEGLCSIVWKMLIVLIHDQHITKFSVTAIPLVLMVVFRIRIYVLERHESEFTVVLNFGILICRVFQFIADLTICMKIDDYIQWNWSETFWWFWIMLSLLLAASFANFLLIVSKFLQYYIRNTSPSEMKAAVWNFLILIHWIAVSVFFVKGLQEYLNSQKTKSLIIMSFINLGSNIIIILTSVLWNKDIDFQLRKLLCLAEPQPVQVPQHPQPQITTDPPSPNQGIGRRFMFPKIMKKLSGAYFGVVTTADDPMRSPRAETATKQIQITKRDNPGSEGSESSLSNCLVCFERPPNAVNMNCGHGGLCLQCALSLWNSSGECYLCRAFIVQVISLDLMNRKGDYLKVVASTQL